MEYREPSRLPPKDGRDDEVIEADAPRLRSRRFDFVPSERHLDKTRIIAAGFAFLVAVGLLGYLGLQGGRGAIDWLRGQPEFQIEFRNIQLQEPPPDWFRGGPDSFLEQVRKAAGESELLSVLQLPKNQIKRDFLASAWVDEVPRVEYPPGGIRVSVVYKVPVAVIALPGGDQVVLDRNGHILPADDIVTEKLGPLVKIPGTGLLPSPENRPGMPWKSSATDEVGARLERGVKGAAQLAGFLLAPDRLRDASSVPIRSLAIIASDHRGLWVQKAKDIYILWGEPPKENDSDAETQEKWDALKRWSKDSISRALPKGDYWEFVQSKAGTRLELRPVETQRPRSS